MIKIRDRKIYIRVASAKPGENREIKYKDGTVISKPFEVYENMENAPQKGA